MVVSLIVEKVENCIHVLLQGCAAEVPCAALGSVPSPAWGWSLPSPWIRESLSSLTQNPIK